MFDLDELRQGWADHDRKLDENIRLNWQLLNAVSVRGPRSALQRVRFFLYLEALTWFLIVVALGSFIHAQIASPRFALPAVLLDVFAIVMLAATVRRLVAVTRIDFAGPIIGIQSRLEALRVLRIRAVQWGLLGGTIVWAPFAIVISKVLFGVGSYSTAWLGANILFGLALIPLGLWIARGFGDRIQRSPLVRRFMNDIAGRNLNSARAFIERLSEYERIDPAV